MKSNDLRQVDAFEVPSPTLEPIPDSIIFAQPSFQRAFALACDTSGLDDKQIYGPLGIDKGQWSRIKSGDANFPMEKYPQFRRLVGNDILLKWIANRCGQELRPLASDLERENGRLREELAQAKRERDVIVQFVKESRLG